MSLILDALRKSEAERRRGEAPSLYTNLPTPGTRRRPTALRYLPLVVVAVLVAVALFAFRKDEAPATKAELAQQSKGDEGAADAAEAGFDAAAAVAPISASAPPPPTSTAAPSTRPPPPAPTVDALVKPVPQAAPAAATALPTPAAPAASAPAAPAPAPEAGADEPLPTIAVLDTTTRAALPALKLSMHFYSADPARRFAIIDGQRVVEGAQLGAAVVTAIRRDGVVLEVNGRRVLLPRP